MCARTNESYRQFENLAKQLMVVPKTELDRKVNEYNKRKQRKKKRSKP